MEDTQPHLRLEQLLSYWEHLAFRRASYKWLALCFPGFSTDIDKWYREHKNNPADPIFSFEQIIGVRKRMLDALACQKDHRQLSRDLFPSDDPVCHEGAVWNLFGWSRSSRRIYQLSADFQLLLQATSLGGLLWQDIELPFEAFALILGEPLQALSGDLYDVALVHRYQLDGSVRMGVTLLSPTLAACNTPHHKLLSDLVYAIRRKKFKKLSPFLTKIQNWPSISPPRTFHFTSVAEGVLHDQPSRIIETNGKVNDVLQAFNEGIEEQLGNGFGRMFVHVARIAIGLSLYLGTRSSSERTSSHWIKPVTQASHPMLVTSEAQVCQVEPAMVLSAELRESLMACAHNGKGYSLSPHFRSGYWSRPVGSGDDPFAKKTVWHNPTIVRKDLLNDGSLPVGKMMSVKK